MAKTGRPTTVITLTDDERETLERWARRPTSAQALAMRCRIVLAASEGAMNKDIAEQVGCNPNTVGKWRRRFAEAGIDGLHDEPRPGAPRKITDADVERVIVKTLEEKPRDATHWSTRSMADQVDLSPASISRIWRAFGLQPHRTEDFKLSPTRSSSTRSATSSACTSAHPTRRSCCAWMKRPRSKRSTARHRYCR